MSTDDAYEMDSDEYRAGWNDGYMKGTDELDAAVRPGFDAGFAAALSEHEQVAWRNIFGQLVPIGAHPYGGEGLEPVFVRRSVQSSEVPPEEEKN